MTTTQHPATPTGTGQAYHRKVWALFAAATVLTAFDAAASWISIELLRIAYEGNGLLSTLGDLIGFEGALSIRVIWGVGLTLILSLLALHQWRKRPSDRRPLAYRGLVIVTIVLGLLAGWHLFVLFGPSP